MEHVLETWPLWVVLLSAFVIGWAAETAETFMSRALALSILAWLQTLPEFAVEAQIAWSQQRDLMIANLTGSLRLILGLGWPMIFFTHFFFQGMRRKEFIRSIKLGVEDSLSVVFLFIAVLYFIVILAKHSLSCWDSVILIAIYAAYLVLLTRLPVHEKEDPADLPWIGKKILALPKNPRVAATVFMFFLGGAALYFSVEPFIHRLQAWSVTFGISTFVFVQWVAPFLSEFPEKISAFNWARQKGKAPLAVMNMVNSNINQWTMLAAMIPLVFSLSTGHFEVIEFDALHESELALTIVQSVLGGILLLDLEFSIFEAFLIFNLWIIQFVFSGVREEITWFYVGWSVWETATLLYRYVRHGHIPRAFTSLKRVFQMMS